MCRTKRATVASNPQPRPSPSTSTPSSAITPTPSFSTSATFSISSVSLAAGLRQIQYPLPDILSAISHPVATLHPSTTWRCSLAGEDVVVLRCPFRGDPAGFPSRVAAACRAHHTSIGRLLGASLADSLLYLVYEHIPGTNLRSCLRNPINPSFTPLSTWLSRVQIAADLVQGLEYIHHHSSSAVHNRIKSSAVIVSDRTLRAKICHFAAAQLSGEIPTTAKEENEAGGKLTRNRSMRIEGTRGYLAPEVIDGGGISRGSDVYAVGVVILELISGDEPLRYRLNPETKVYERISIVDTATDAIGIDEEEEEAAALADFERRRRVRRWVDRRLGDSFPEEAANRLVRVALRCTVEDAAARPTAEWVAGKVSGILLESKTWDESMKKPVEISVSIAPR